ncbi:LysE/ArgO family amino acid transporter [Ornithinimicrobium sp. F0845]|uniref:LysE/ArgO family amino acid transporter n=1 Tax=Ornithinimicrobium sp. F0845 TaxID=2926412 RepID=UPI001FF5B825|nr:LysE/ArgO family amino acid transporter [Ornithinimicrobium sp. F0845]
MLPIVLAGLVSGLGLIIAIGAQNAFVLRQGIRREHIGTVVLVCALADILLITIGTAGVGALVSSSPTVLTAIRWLGAAYLLWFAWGSLRSAARPTGLVAQAPTSRGSVLAMTLALTFLNPHVYLDTVLLLGMLAASHEDARWWFALGACVGSILWFTVLGLGARALSRPLSSPTTWRVVDLLVAAVMVTLAVRLVLG